MLDLELTYDFYANTFGGALDEETFSRSLKRALCRLSTLVHGNPESEHEEALKMALCAILDREAGADTTGLVTSETVGSVSRSYSQAAIARTDLDAVRPYLARTGLLFAGIGCNTRY